MAMAKAMVARRGPDPYGMRNGRIPGCRSRNHRFCKPFEDAEPEWRGGAPEGLWRCPFCALDFCMEEGCGDDFDGCDACWILWRWYDFGEVPE